MSPIDGRHVFLIVVFVLGIAEVHVQDETRPKSLKPDTGPAIIQVRLSVPPPAQAHTVGVKPLEKMVEIRQASPAATVLEKSVSLTCQ